MQPAFKYGESNATYDSMAAVILHLTGVQGYAEYIRRLVAMLVTGNTDAHLKNWALIYLDGRTPSLSPVYDFHSLTVYGPYRYAPMALSLNGQRLASAVGPDDLRWLADRAGADPDRTVEWAAEALDRLRKAWTEDVRAEAESRYPALAKHYSQRLDTLPIRALG